MLSKNIPDYTEKPIIEKLAKGKGINPTETLNLLVKSGRKTFTKGGDFRTNQASAFYDVLREGLRSDFKQKAPTTFFSSF